MKILIIDCFNIGYAAAYTTNDLSYNNFPTGVIYGFLNQIFHIAQKEYPCELVFCWDSKASKRRDIYPNYKIHRSTKPDKIDRESVYRQFDELRECILPSMGFEARTLYRDGYEADDLIAWVTQSCSKHSCRIVSSDEDLYQLLTDDVDILKPRKKNLYFKEDLITEYGVRPDQWPIVKAISGCESDNILGIVGVGNKTAAKYVSGKLNPKSKVYPEIENNKEMIERNTKLVRLPFKDSTEWEEPFKIRPIVLKKENFYRVFREYGLNDFIRQMRELTQTFGLV